MGGKEEYEVGETVELTVQFYDWSNVLTDVDTCVVSIWDAAGNAKLTEAAATHRSTGNYYYLYTIPDATTVHAVEQWRYLFKGTVGDVVQIDKGYFTVTENPVTYYGTVWDVELLLQHDITDTTNPSMQQVTRLIKRKEELIEQMTKTAWREMTVTEEIHYQRENPGGGLWIYFPLNYTPVREISKFEIRSWDSDWVDYTSDTNLYQVDTNLNQVRVYRYYTGWARWKSMRITYTYGYSRPTQDVVELCTKLVTLDVLKGERYAHLLPHGADSVLPMMAMVNEYKEDTDRIWNRLRKIGLS